jgi:sulfatase maturation enzyme AslB (radical SAM superfamily)
MNKGERMSTLPVQDHSSSQHPFRLDVQLHELLTKPPASPAIRTELQIGGDAKFPEPVFPQHPQLLAQDDNYEENLAQARAGKRPWSAQLVMRAMHGWLFPYMKSRALPGPFHPIIAYLFTEWKCNLDCHYCWAFDNSVKGMTEEVAKRSIDWLHSTTCRVLAFMGGEPLLPSAVSAQSVLLRSEKGLLDLYADERASASS